MGKYCYSILESIYRIEVNKSKKEALTCKVVVIEVKSTLTNFPFYLVLFRTLSF